MKIKELSPTKVPKLSIKRVAAYARVSTEKELQMQSLSIQVDHYRESINKHPGWELVDIYADAGISGTLAKRPEFQRMLTDCRDGKIDMVITKSISRFARNTITLLEAMRELRSLNIDIYFENEKLHSISENGDFLIRLIATTAEDYSRSLSENVKWGIQKKFESGIANGCGRILGYRLHNNQFVIVPEEAEIVRGIYADFLSGMTGSAIARKLSAQGAKTARGGQWTGNIIRLILSNEKYMGDLLLQKSYIENYRTKKQIMNNGQRKRYYVENSHEPIIPKSVFRAVQKEIARRRRRKAPYRRPIKTQYSGLIKCADCGAKLWRGTANGVTRHPKPAWTCSTFIRKGKSVCNMRVLQEPLLDVLTRETLELESLKGVNLRDYIEEIICDREGLIFKLKNGEEKYAPRRKVAYY